MKSHYNQRYTKEQIESILQVIQDCVRCNRFTIELNENRQENIDFINNYNITPARQKDILLKIKVEDFCHSVKNIKIGYEHEILYVFCPQIILFNLESKEELVDVYIKFNILDYASGKRIITISFHKRNLPLDYLFRYFDG